TPAPGHAFAGWSGACAGTNPVCTVTLTEARAVTATFNATVTYHRIFLPLVVR
ncbi:InlB B-repeat-containing protein, partial [Roseiflexus sp.]|uniref:InlB B-repeat-containing protein n=1 Tax=Roseiflexus sp. TaxID=2562120 RepID=UPI00398AB285